MKKSKNTAVPAKNETFESSSIEDNNFHIGMRVRFDTGNLDPEYRIEGFLKAHPEYKKIRGRVEQEGVIIVAVRDICNCQKYGWSGFSMHADSCPISPGCIYSGPRITIRMPDGKILPEEFSGVRFEEPKAWKDRNTAVKKEVEAFFDGLFSKN